MRKRRRQMNINLLKNPDVAHEFDFRFNEKDSSKYFHLDKEKDWKWYEDEDVDTNYGRNARKQSSQTRVQSG